jgi:hypothetical protein
MYGFDLHSLYILVCSTGWMILTVGTKAFGANPVSVPPFCNKSPPHWMTSDWYRTCDMRPGFDLQPFHVWIFIQHFVTGTCYSVVFSIFRYYLQFKMLWIYSRISELKRFQWPHGLRSWFAVASYGINGFESRRGRGWLSVVSVVFCQVVSVTGWSLVQRSPTECGASECVGEACIIKRPWPSRICRSVGKKIKIADVIIINNWQFTSSLNNTLKSWTNLDVNVWLPCKEALSGGNL